MIEIVSLKFSFREEGGPPDIWEDTSEHKSPWPIKKAINEVKGNFHEQDLHPIQLMKHYTFLIWHPSTWPIIVERPKSLGEK